MCKAVCRRDLTDDCSECGTRACPVCVESDPSRQAAPVCRGCLEAQRKDAAELLEHLLRAYGRHEADVRREMVEAREADTKATKRRLLARDIVSEGTAATLTYTYTEAADANTQSLVKLVNMRNLMNARDGLPLKTLDEWDREQEPGK